MSILNAVELPVQIERTSDGVTTRYRLPVRELGMARLAGMVPLVFGVFFAGFATFWIMGASGLILGQGHPHPFQLIFALWGVPFVLSGLWTIRIGLLTLLPSRCEIVVDEKRIMVRDSAGLIRWTRRIRRERITAFTVGRPIARPNQTSSTIGMGDSLMATLTRGKPKAVALAYPREWLEALAYSLAGDCRLARPEDVLRTDEQSKPPSGPAVIIEQAGAPAAVEEQVTTQPPDSKIQLAENGDTLTVLIPPNGFRGMTRALLTFSLVWNAFIAVFITVLVLAATGALKGKQHGNPIIGFLFMIPFAAVGVATMLAAINSARRRTVLLITAESVIFTQKGLFGEKEKQWVRQNLRSIRVGPSGTTINNQPVLELKLEWIAGKPFGMLAGRPEPELQWLRSELRRRLKLNAA